MPDLYRRQRILPGPRRGALALTLAGIAALGLACPDRAQGPGAGHTRGATLELADTASLIADPALRARVDELAAARRIESRAVGEAGAPSKVYEVYEDLSAALTADQACALLRHRSPVVRGYMIRLVVDRHRPRLSALVPLLRDRTAVERQDGCLVDRSTIADDMVQVLGQRAEQAEVQELLLRIARDASLEALRGEALPALVKHRPREVEAIASGLLEAQLPDLLRKAIMVLGMTGARAAAPAIARHARHSDSLLRAQVASTLGFLCAGAETRATLEALTRDDDDYVRMSAATAYARCPHPDAARVGELLADPRPRVREGMALGLAHSARPETLHLLRPLLMSSGCPGPVMQALVQKQRGPHVTALVRELLGSRDGYVRARAAGYLAEVGDAASAPAIRRLLNAETIHERQAAADALARLGDGGAIPLLEGLLQDPNPHGRIAAARALVALRARGALPALQRAVDREGSWAAKTLAELLGQLRALR